MNEQKTTTRELAKKKKSEERTKKHYNLRNNVRQLVYEFMRYEHPGLTNTELNDPDVRELLKNTLLDNFENGISDYFLWRVEKIKKLGIQKKHKRDITSEHEKKDIQSNVSNIEKKRIILIKKKVQS
jgi:hypothetical protein